MRDAWALLLLALYGSAVGCRNSSAEEGGINSTDAVAKAIGEAVVTGGAQPGCGRPSPKSVPSAVIAVTAQQCLNCLDVGNLLRGAERDARREGNDLRVVVRTDEVSEVCEFLDDEKVRLPVAVVRPESFPRDNDIGDLIYVQFGSGPAVARVIAAPTGMQLLEKIRGSGQPPSNTARTMSR